jgi:adenylate cyclase
MTEPAPPSPPQEFRLPDSFDTVLGRRIIEFNRWAVREGLRGTSPQELFDGMCQRLVADGVPLWRGFVTTRTLHPQWSGYGFEWRRDLNAINPLQWEHGSDATPEFQRSTFFHLIRRAEAGEHNPALRRRLAAGPEARDFAILEDLYAAGATDYFTQLFPFGEKGDPAQGEGVIYSFATDRGRGFSDDDLTLLQTSLPALSLAIKAYAGYVIASNLLQAYLGADAGRRVHAGAIKRGSVERIRAVLWYADIRGFTAIADAAPEQLVELLDDVFEALAQSLRGRAGEVLKFLGDGMLAIFPIGEAPGDTCRAALQAAGEAMQGIAALNAARALHDKPVATVDLALHLGEVFYGNVGAVDRLDFTVIGPAVNEVARIESLCEPLGRPVLVSAELAAAVGDSALLEPLGRHVLRGLKEAREIFGLVPPRAS